MAKCSRHNICKSPEFHDSGRWPWTLETPNWNRIKVNFDATIFDFSNCYNFAVVARNYSGDLIEAFFKCSPSKIYPEVIEKIGIWEALYWVKSQQYSEVEVGTDYFIMVQAIRAALRSCHIWGGLLRIAKTCWVI